jgi:CubicO group peptidase (beta-lactamase class C family)
VLGRILEVLHGMPYRVILRECLLDPLGMASTTTALHEVLSRRHAAGHVVGANRTAEPAPAYATMPAYVPGGSQTVSTAADMLRFLALHRNLGRTTDGVTLLSESVTRLMHQPHAEVPDVGADDAWGLGFALGRTTDGSRTIRHGGRTPNQVADMVLLPDDGLAVVVLTNSTAGGPVTRTLIPDVVAALTDTSLPDPIPERSTTALALHLDRYAGMYVHGGTRILVSVSSDQLVVEADAASLMPGAPPLRVSTAVEALDRVRFRTLAGPPQVIAFEHAGPDGRPEILFAAGRIHRRTDPDFA